MQNYKILVVDDEISNLKIHIEYLIEADNNYEIMQANGGKLALEIINKKKPDLILLDWEMPEISGLDVISEIRKNKETKDIAVIVITGRMTSTENLKKALETGAVDFMRKPIEKVEFVARVKSMLSFIENYRAKINNELKINTLLTDKINFRNRELASSTLFLSKQNAEVIKIIEELEITAKTGTSENLSDIINKSVNKLKFSINDSIWDNFKMRFEKIHPDFIKNLRTKIDILSPTEQKLSILLRLNLSSKEIADILSIQIDSVKTARSRLRKKFQLTRDENMLQYLSNF